MRELVEQQRGTEPVGEVDLVAVLTEILVRSPEPLTAPRLRAALPECWRSLDERTLDEVLRRQVSANVFHVHPRYRSPHERYWHRPLRAHLADLVLRSLQEGPLSWNELRRRQPDYARTQAESVLEDLVAHGQVHRHPPTSSRKGPRFGLVPADARVYVRPALEEMFARLARLGFSAEQLREAAMGVLQESEWEPSRADR